MEYNFDNPKSLPLKSFEYFRKDRIKYNSLLENMDAGLFLLIIKNDNHDFFIRETNLRSLELLNQDYSGKYLSETIFNNILSNQIKETIKTSKRHYVKQYIKQLDKYFNFIIFRVNTHCLAIIIVDITDEEILIKQLKESEDKFKTLTKRANVGIFVYQNNKCVFVNESASDITGYTLNELYKQKSTKILDSYMIDMKNLLDSGPITNKEIYINTKFKDIKCVLISCEISQYKQHDAVIVIMLDITENKKLLNQLIHAQKLDSIGVFASGIAHNLNNILQAIMMTSDYLELKYKNDNFLMHKITRLQESCKKGAKLINDLMIFSRTSSNIENLSVINIEKFLGKTIAFSKLFIPTTIKIKKNFSFNPMVYINQTQIESVMINLINNSVYALKNKINAKIEITTELASKSNILLDKNKQYVLIKFRDNGCGISKSNLVRIFDPFFTTNKLNGTGLGLSTSYSIIKEHMGIITCSSEIDKYTEFKIFLPIQQSYISVKQDTNENICLLSELASKIFIIEDDLDVIKGYKDLFIESKCNIDYAVDGNDALIKLKSNVYDVILTDLDVPIISGVNLLKKIRELTKQTKIIIISGYFTESLIKETCDMDVFAYLIKPINILTLINTLHDCLEKD